VKHSPRVIISYCLIAVFALDHAAMFVNAFDIGHTSEPQLEETVCGCTCCGDVCPMGASCCCYVPNESGEPNPMPIQITDNACSPNPFQHHDYSFFFTSIKWLEASPYEIEPVRENAGFQECNVIPMCSRQVEPPTPPPDA